MTGLPILSGVVPHGDLYAHALSSAYNYEWRRRDPDLSHARDPDIWAKIHRDARVSQAISHRCGAVAGGEWTVEAASADPMDQALAEIIREGLKGVVNFRESRKRLAHCIFRGRSYAYIEGTRKLERLGDYPAQEWWLPQRLRDIDKRRVQIVPHTVREDNERPRNEVKKQLWDVAGFEWRDISPNNWKSLIEVVYDDTEERLGYGRPVLEQIYFLWWAKMEIMSQGLAALERFAGGSVLVHMDPENHGGGLGRDADSIRDAYIDEIGKMRGEHCLVVPKGDEVSVVTGGSEGSRMVQDMLAYIDAAIISTTLGATLPFGVGMDTGSLARAEVERDVSESFLQADRDVLDEAISRKLIGQFIDLNRPLLAELDLELARAPKFVTVQQPREDPGANSAVISSALASGIPLRKDEVYSKLGFTMPTDEDEVLEAPAMGMGMGMDMGMGMPFQDRRRSMKFQ